VLPSMRSATVVLSAALAVACGGGAKAPEPTAQTVATQPAKAVAPATPATTADFGVPECDEYVKQHLACIESKVPESARAMARQTLDQTRSAWRRAATTPGERAALAAACKQAEAIAKQTMAMYGCSW